MMACRALNFTYIGVKPVPELYTAHWITGQNDDVRLMSGAVTVALIKRPSYSRNL